ncbi:hypothetical protein OA410_04510 [Paracoccaceae bacterium]|nr:hypothetical protein [Paracoccaceae bacterium]
MKNLSILLGGLYLLMFLSGCLSIGSGPLTNSISIPIGQSQVKHKLPRGFCLDRSANNSTALRETLVVTNCIEVNNGDKLYFSRRPVDAIVNITFTQSRVPKKISQKKYLSEIAKKIEFKKFTAAFSNKKLIYGEKKLQNKFFYVNFQMVSASKRKEFVRKYFFLVDNKVVVMTIVSFHKPRKSTYSSFENFIKKLSKLNS